eukprot:CAMPEP_0168396706 /NCGR_PEP_ID=MMETSP0228-20121227/20689_1 /TAXON_ID=133427 /ORGANISM="Protoceratium reticulatum, Strain CCCM 535 (=CCMP 1889)" /LENGTH=553 /DNA_ID=CAMNT_0008410161 /DNA_START=56 /DNA_END=1717 /DNA_ORIENTATION=+
MSPGSLPSTLYVISPNGQQWCSGDYVLQPEETANNHPVWKQAGGGYWLYSGSNGMWIIGGSDAKDKAFDCSKGQIFCRVLHGGTTPDKVGGVWIRLKNDTFVEDITIKVTTGCDRPSALRIVCPNGQRRCAGEYVLHPGEVANGHPVWKQKGGRCWFYSGSNGTWIVGGSDAKEKDFQCSRGVIYSKRPHGGALPDKASSAWLRLDGSKFSEDSDIIVSAKPSPLYVRSPHGQQRCAGEYVPVADKIVNGQPLWEHLGGKCWLYSGTNGMWIIGGGDAAERSFQCTRGVLYCKTPHGGLTPDKMVGIWLRLEGETFREDAAISVSTEPVSLFVVSPLGQQRCAGEYMIRSGESVYGHSVWKQRKGQHWLYSTRTGTWVIGTSDAKDGKSGAQPTIQCVGPHKGSNPDKVGGAWKRMDGTSFCEDLKIMVTTVISKPAKLHVASPNGQQRCAGEYALVAGEAANGHPLWRQMGGKYWLYSGTNGMWIIGSSGAKDKNFDCSRGVIYSNTSHGGVMPDKVEGVWLRLEGESFREDSEITVTTEPAALRLLDNKAA